MISFVLSQTDSGGTAREAERVKQMIGHESEAADTWSLPSGVGEVQPGSLEEAMWGELGALPASRRTGPKMLSTPEHPSTALPTRLRSARR